MLVSSYPHLPVYTDVASGAAFASVWNDSCAPAMFVALTSTPFDCTQTYIEAGQLCQFDTAAEFLQLNSEEAPAEFCISAETLSQFCNSSPKAQSKASRKKKRRRAGQPGSTGGDQRQELASQGFAKDCQDIWSGAANKFNSGNEPAPVVPLLNQVQSAERCHRIVASLEANSSRAKTLESIIPGIKVFASSKHGTRVAQKALEVADAVDQAEIIKQLKGSVVDLYRSPHGNYLVTKLIEVVPPASVEFVLEELKGSAVEAAKHQYGCRVLERLIEHCPPEKVGGLVEELLQNVEPLCRHQFGNFVMQHILEHGLQQWKEEIAWHMANSIALLAKHRTASHVVQKALYHGQKSVQDIIVLALIKGEGEDALVEVACERYGSYVVEELISLRDHYGSVHQQLKDGLDRLLSSDPYGKRIAEKFGLSASKP